MTEVRRGTADQIVVLTTVMTEKGTITVMTDTMVTGIMTLTKVGIMTEDMIGGMMTGVGTGPHVFLMITAQMT